MSKQRIQTIMKRLDLHVGPLAHVATVREYREAIVRLSEPELIEEYKDALRAHGRTLSNEELLAELAKARQEAAEVVYCSACGCNMPPDHAHTWRK